MTESGPGGGLRDAFFEPQIPDYQIPDYQIPDHQIWQSPICQFDNREPTMRRPHVASV